VLEYIDKFEPETGVINYIQPGFAVVVDIKHEVYLQNMEIDYVRQGLNEGFEFRNPNERDRCGCGESFRV
jgi:iron-sulfur cluster assembly protein